LKNSLTNLQNHMFKTLYVEKQALNYEITNKVIKKNSYNNIVYIDHYKDVFNRSKQDFLLQKNNLSLILAVKPEPFIYDGPEICQNFGFTDFYYSTFLMNCFFDCEYCYLQGVYPSGNIVAFVNIEDFKDALNKITLNKKIFLAASYDTDLLAFHNVIPYMDYLYDFISKNKNLLVELRTKSSNELLYKNYKPLKNLLIGFSLAPEKIIDMYENKTPSLDARINAIKTAISYGFKVRLCFDPIFVNKSVNNLYEEFFNKVFSEIDSSKITDVGYGFFRIPKDYYKRIEKQRESSLVFVENYHLSNNIVSYPSEIINEIQTKHINQISKYIDKERIFKL
jgi:spore photoproduct lyase